MATILSVGATGVFATPTYASTTGCGSQSHWHWISAYHSNYLDGSPQSYPTVVVALSDFASGSAWMVRSKVWGTQAAINAIQSRYQKNASAVTGIYKVTFNTQSPSGSPVTFSGSACPNSGNVSLGLWNVILDYVPYVGSAVSVLANYINVGVSRPTNTSYQQMAVWNYPSKDRLLPSNQPTTHAEEYKGYSQQVAVNGNAGNQIKTAGTVEYQTTYYSDPPVDRYVYYAYDTSGTPTASGALEPYR